MDFPLITVSNYSAIEKDIKTGSVAAIHVWWARRPLSACRAMNLACLLPDPLDKNCSKKIMKIIATSLDDLDSKISQGQLEQFEKKKKKKIIIGDMKASRNKPERLRKRLLEFIL